MSASILMVLAALLFATMGVCIKLATAQLPTAEVVMYRGLIGMALMAGLLRLRRQGARTPVPWMHVTRGLFGVAAMMCWFYAIAGLPLATAVTLNYMSSIWMALFVVAGAMLWGGARADWRLVVTVFVGFAGVAAILQPTMARDQVVYGLIGLASGVLSAVAYLQITALGRVGEPEERVVFWFSCATALAGLGLAWVTGGLHPLGGWSAVWVLAVGLLASVAQVLMTRAYAIGRPLVNASLNYLGIPFAFGYGVWLFDDPVTWPAVAGMALVAVAGLVAVRLRESAPHKTGEARVSELDA